MADKLGVTINLLYNNASYKDDLGIDSLDMIETLMEIEKHFNITINEEDAEKLETIESLTTHISQHLN
ncbi:acyl carrier protein [Ferruginibacter sp.]|uniref:acyl carrier protein n=1 Tax=Ferruginibacter sp. TaxID=1940288 RepID=UPI00265AB55A|nr:acyl carrier protein [Ferruginibacter sp.]